jgi:hypothetical protein
LSFITVVVIRMVGKETKGEERRAARYGALIMYILHLVCRAMLS